MTAKQAIEQATRLRNLNIFYRKATEDSVRIKIENYRGTARGYQIDILPRNKTTFYHPGPWVKAINKKYCWYIGTGPGLYICIH